MAFCLDFPVRSYKGHKAIVISTVSWIGGKNPFLGWAYVAAASLFVALAILGTIRHMIKPRYTYLSIHTHMEFIAHFVCLPQKIRGYVTAVLESVVPSTLRLYAVFMIWIRFGSYLYYSNSDLLMSETLFYHKALHKT